MSDPFATQRNKYKHTVSASALLFNYDGHRALRVEAESVGLEFTDNAYIGSGESDIVLINCDALPQFGLLMSVPLRS